MNNACFNKLHRTNAPDQQELVALMHTISHRVAGFLKREGILERDEENSCLNLEEGGFSRKSWGLNRLRPDRRIFQAYPAFSSQP